MPVIPDDVAVSKHVAAQSCTTEASGSRILFLKTAPEILQSLSISNRSARDLRLSTRRTVPPSFIGRHISTFPCGNRSGNSCQLIWLCLCCVNDLLDNHQAVRALRSVGDNLVKRKGRKISADQNKRKIIQRTDKNSAFNFKTILKTYNCCDFGLSIMNTSNAARFLDNQPIIVNNSRSFTPFLLSNSEFPLSGPAAVRN